MLPADYLQQLKAAFPKRDGGHGWSMVPRLIATYTTEMDWPEILLGTQNYYRHCGRKQATGTEFVMQAKTFYGRDCHWREWAEMDLRTPQQVAEDTRWRQLEDRAMALGFTTVDRTRGYSVALSAVEQAERQRDGQIARELRLVKS